MKTKKQIRLFALVFALLLLLSAAPIVAAQSGGEGENGEEAPGENFFCLDLSVPHPVGSRIASKYETSYEQVMDWFCGGFGFGQIKLALSISALTGESPDVLLDLKAGGLGWGEIRQELGLTGPPEWARNGKDDLPGNGNRKPFDGHGPPPWAGQPGGPWGGGPPFIGD